MHHAPYTIHHTQASPAVNAYPDIRINGKVMDQTKATTAKDIIKAVCGAYTG
jgi:hypothetical protein